MVYWVCSDLNVTRPNKLLSRSQLLIINGAALTSCAVFDYAWRTHLLIGLILFLPLLDKSWSLPDLSFNKPRLISWLIPSTISLWFIILKPDNASVLAGTLILVALPEEWFFRAYIMRQLETSAMINRQFLKPLLQPALTANILSSALFALLHTPTQGWFGLSIFFPSLLLGWLYQQNKDLIFVILIHGLLNLFFINYLGDLLYNV